MARPDDDTWEVYDEDRPFLGGVYSKQRVRMAVIGLGNGGLLVVSPGAPTSDARFEQLAKWGTPRFLLAPNHFHNGGIATWKARFPQATVVAHERALPRLRKKVPGVELQDLSALQAALPEGVRLFSPPMAKQGETWVSVKTTEGTAWLVTDGILNETRLPGGPLGLLLRVFGFRTELLTNPFFKRFFLTDKAAYKVWVREELERDRPTLFVPSHGAVLRGPDVADRLRAVTDAA
jgi:glyoxylase-like metal-dependent hydrolase (beta-lactamase superfamily II)